MIREAILFGGAMYILISIAQIIDRRFWPAIARTGWRPVFYA